MGSIPSSENDGYYLSVVTVTRNDNHGGDVNRRTQAFINGLAETCQRHRLRVELIMVEWNPPEDRQSLADELTWPESGGYCEYRIITVPAEIHSRHKASEHLPLYQMIGKNVGIRRAKGEFVLATNIDLLFSDELISWISKRRLRKGYHYRMDRIDVPAEVTELNGLEKQLDYCKSNILRVNSRFGTMTLQKWKEFQNRPGLFSGLLARIGNCSNAIAGHVRNTSPHKLIRPSCYWRLSKRVLKRARAFTESSINSLIPSINDIHRLGLRAMIIRLGHIINRPSLHTNACGDFTMMAKEDWDVLQGYPELEVFSWHLDSLILYMAHYADIQQSLLPYPVYHIEHAGGWTPEQASKLWRWVKSKDIPYLTNEDLARAEQKMRYSDKPIKYNKGTWGITDVELPESIPDLYIPPDENREDLRQAA